MSNTAAFFLRRPVGTYFAMTFAISWGGVLILGSPYGIPANPDQAAKVWPLVFLPYFLGPSVACLFMTGLVSGRAGLRALIARFFKWRADIRWAAVALLTAPFLVGGLALLLSRASRDFLPVVVTAEDRVGVVVRGILVGLIFGGFLEELGWTGFAVPRLRKTYGIFASGLIVGFLHGLWHVLPTYWATGDPSGTLSLVNFIPPLFFYAGVLPAFRVLMVWVYDRTESLLWCMLMHASLSASAPWILLPAASGGSLVIYYLILSIVMWALAGWVVLFSRRIGGGVAGSG